MCLLIGWKTYVLVQLPILMISTTIGIWLFYVQHNFDPTYWDNHEGWEFVKAGLQGSSFYKLPLVLQWFSGNIGFHHIHHLSAKIPNYNLPKCYYENPLFHVKPLTIRASLKSLSLRLYDEEQKMLDRLERTQTLSDIKSGSDEYLNTRDWCKPVSVLSSGIFTECRLISYFISEIQPLKSM